MPDTGAGSGTVTSVALTAPNIFFVLGTPITTSGTLQLGLVNQFANTVWAGPISGPENVPTFRLLVSDDIPNLDISKITTGTLGVDRGGTGATSLTGVLFGNGTGAFTALGSTTANQMLRVNSSGSAYEWFTPDYLSNPMTQMGDMIRGNAVGFPVRLPGNPTGTLMYLTSEGDGTTPFPPYWSAITAAAIGAVPSTRQLTINGNTQDLSIDRTFNVGTVTSVALSVPSAFSVTGSPITSNGTLAITGAGTSSQYVRGDGQLANFPTSAGGGSSVKYYLNGSVSQGTFGGDTYYQMSKSAVIGAGTNFTRTNGMGDGYIASFITDAGDPGLLSIPGGAWNLEFYFNASSSGGTPQFYAEIYVVDSLNNFTLIATDVANPEPIGSGTVVDLYVTSIAVPQTTLLITDRIAIRIFVITGGRSITLHTEDSNLCEVLTTFSTGLTAINGLTDQVQFLATGTAGTDFNINSAGDTHTFNIPTASSLNRGLLNTADWIAFNDKMNNPFSALGQMVYSNAAGIPLVVVPNITTTKKFLSMTGSGTTGAAPVWSDISGSIISSSFQIDYDSAVIGTRNSVNKIFTVSSNFVTGSTRVFVNGLRYSNGITYDYTETAANQITFTNAPDNGDLIIIEYIKA